MPDTYYAYGSNINELKLSDTRTIMHEQRFMLTNNILDPKVYQVTKVVDLSPSGVVKLSIKQDEINLKEDNIELRICNYYTDSGDQKVDSIIIPQASKSKSIINWMYVNDDGELQNLQFLDDSEKALHLGKLSYFQHEGKYPDETSVWKLSLINNENYTSDEVVYYEGLMKVDNIDKSTISIKPGKANSLIGKKFILSVEDNSGFDHTSIELEVLE